MHIRKHGFLKTPLAIAKRIFHSRNIIVVSDHKVEHIPLSGSMQILLVLGLLGFFSGISYLTGSYMTAASSLRAKDRTIAADDAQSTRVGAEMTMLKRDLVKLSQNGKDLGEYSKFIIDQYANDVPQGKNAPNRPNLFGQTSDKLQERINYLESRVQEMHDENDHLVTSIRDRTDKKISLFEDIIGMTGLDSDRLERLSARAHHAPNTARAAPATPAEDDSAGKDTHAAAEGGEGGPFIPYDANEDDTNRELLADVDRLVVLHDIVNQLPLAQPLHGSQVTGPFGKRVDPINGHWAIHPGLDLVGATNAPIHATNAGKVIFAGRRVAYGNMVDVDHGFGIVTRYAHMSRITVHAGQTVCKGQQVGVQGSTGRTTGPHLHYEVRINDRPVNPVKFLRAGQYVSEN